MSLRWQFTRDSRFIVEYKVEIFDSEYSGSPITLDTVGGEPLEIEMGRQGADHLDNIRGTNCTVRLFGKSGDFDDLFSRDLNRFRIHVTVDGDTYQYIPLPDTFTDYVTNGKFTNEIQAADISVLRQFRALDILPENERMSKLDAIYQIVNHVFDYNIVDGTIEYPAGGSTNFSALNLIKFNTSRFEDESAYEALEWLVTKVHQLRVSRGKVFIFPALEASFVGYEYNGNSVSSGVTYNQNFTAVFKGGRLGTTRSKLRSYDGVERIYEPLQAPNIVPGGDFSTLDDFNYVTTSSPRLRRRVGLPIGWSPVIPGFWRIRSTGIESSPYSAEIPIGAGVWQAQTDTLIFEGQRLRLGVNVEFNSTRNVFWALPVQVRIGDFVLQSDWQVSGTNLIGEGELSWVNINQATQPYALILGRSGDTVNYSRATPASPVSGEASFRVASPAAALGILGGFNQSVSPNDFATLYQIALNAVDEEGDIIERSESFSGERGEVYRYTERFGDGFTSINPGALYFNDTPSQNWQLRGLAGSGSLAEIQPAYMLSELKRDRDVWRGTADVFDFLALIEGKRVNYISTNFRYGNSRIELVEIAEHDLVATGEERRERGVDGGGRGGTFDPETFRPDLDRLQAIGEITRDYNEEVTDTLDCNLDLPVRKGIEYWIVNESELIRSDRDAGVYPIVPQTTDSEGNRLLPEDAGYEEGIREYGGGVLTVPIQEQVINAPEGSLIFKAPGQDEIELNVGEEKDREFDERIGDLNTNLDQLEIDLNELNTVTLPALNEDLDQLEVDLNTLNTVTLPNLQSELDDILPITETKITDNAITAPKIASNAVIAGKIAANAVTANEIAANAVIANKIQAGAVIAGKIGADAVVANNIAADAVTTNKIQAGAVTAIKIDVDDLAANSAFIDELMAQILIIRSGGVITNSSENFKITDSGMWIDSGTVFDVARNLGFGGSQASPNTSIWLDASAGIQQWRFVGGGGRETRFDSGNIRLTATGGGSIVTSLMTLSADRMIADFDNIKLDQTNFDIDISNNVIFESGNDIRMLASEDFVLGYNDTDRVIFEENFTSGNGAQFSSAGYILVRINGSLRRIPAYLNS